MYDEKFIELLKDKVVLSDVIGRRIKLIIRGKAKMALCPFHNEKTPSFHIDDEKEFYHCFGCGESGDAIKFLEKMDGLSFKEAVEKLAEDYGVPLPKIQKSEKAIELENKYAKAYKIMGDACKFFEKNLSLNKIPMDYLLKRGIKLENMKFFRLGYAPNSFTSLMIYLKSLGYSENEMESLGLIVKGDKGYYDKFKHRVMFPVIDKKGRVIAFTGRVLDDRLPKYMNSPETILYHKGDVLFNYFYARKAIYDSNSSYLVEGNVDAISMYINGVENVVAPMGTATTINQIQELWTCCDNINLCFDGDGAGQKAMVRVAHMILPILQPKKQMKFIFLPAEDDPDSYIKVFGKKAFLTYVSRNSCSLSEFLLKNELKKLDIEPDQMYITPENHNILEVRLKEIVSEIKDPIVAKNFAYFFKNQLWNLFKYKKDSKKINYQEITKIQNYKVKQPLFKSDEDFDLKLFEIEKSILKYLCVCPDLIDKLFEKFNIDVFSLNFSNEKLKEVLNIILDNYSDEENKKNILVFLEKNNLNNYINNKMIIQKDNQDKCLINLYILLLDREEIIYMKELRNVILKQEAVEKINAIQSQLLDLITKREQLRSKE